MKTSFHDSEHKHQHPSHKVRILRVYVGPNQEIGVVYGFKNPNGKGVKVRGQRKCFASEAKKLHFLAELQNSGFTRFQEVHKTLDPEKMVFEVMTSLQTVSDTKGAHLAQMAHA